MDKLHLNSEKGWLGGVCAGLADYFEIEPFIVRIIAVVATLTWSLTIVAYIVMYFIMSKKKPNIEEMSNQFNNSKIGNSGIGQHFKNIDYKKRIYKNTSDKKISGVCSGLADYFETSPLFIRLACVLSLFFGPFAIFGYIVAAIIMDEAPYNTSDSLYENYGYSVKKNSSKSRTHSNSKQEKTSEHENGEERKHRRRQHSNHNSFSSRPYINKRDIAECDKTFTDLEIKLQKLEATITSKKFRLHNEIKRMAT